MKNFAGASEGSVEVGADVFAADAVEEAAFVHDKQGLGVRRAEDEVFAFAAEFFVKVFEGVQAAGVYDDDGAHAQDENVGLLVGALESGFEFVGGAEKECAEDAIDHDAVRDFLAGE